MDGVTRLLEHHMKETGRRFDEVSNHIEELSLKLDGLSEFKVRTIVNARWVSMVVSGVCGFITMVVTAFVAYISNKH
jgi:ABC-type glycerol-3-phosphate transport system permease component